MKGNWKMPPLNMPLGRRDYFELKVIENQQVQKKLSKLGKNISFVKENYIYIKNFRLYRCLLLLFQGQENS